MNANSQTQIDSDEIDLISVIRKTIVLYRKWKKKILLFFVIGISLSLLFFLVSPKTYLSRMYVASNLLKGPSFILLVDDLQKHVKDNNNVVVAELLGITEVEAKLISKIEVYSSKNFAEKEFADLITQSYTDSENEINNGEFVIQLLINDNTIIKKVEHGIISYLNNNEFSKIKSLQRRNGLRMVKERIHNELNELDSLRYSLNKLYTNGGDSKGSSRIIMNDPSSIYNNILSLFRSEISTNDEINTPDISIIQGFTTYKKQYSPKLLMCLITGIVGSIVFSFFYILLSELKQKLAETE